MVMEWCRLLKSQRPSSVILATGSHLVNLLIEFNSFDGRLNIEAPKSMGP